MQEQFRFAALEHSWLFFILIGFIGMFILSFVLKKKKNHAFISQSMFHILSKERSIQKIIWKCIVLWLGFLFLILALLRPQGEPEKQSIQKKGRDLIFVIDVSRSMLAEDLRPNRLERAKQLIRDVVDILEGDRVGLVIFAGTSMIKCPLTSDYYYFKNVLDQVTPNDVRKGGTLIGDAIRTVTEQMFQKEDAKYRDVILITDGEDHKSFPIEAAHTAAEKNIHIHTVGLGDPDGSLIPLRDENTRSILKYKERVVRTRLDEKTLKEIATITKGIYVPVHTNQVDMAHLYTKFIMPKEKRDTLEQESAIWSEKYSYFLLIALFFFLLEMFINEEKKWFCRKSNH